jgi:hypothetical protein
VIYSDNDLWFVGLIVADPLRVRTGAMLGAVQAAAAVSTTQSQGSGFKERAQQ